MKIAQKSTNLQTEKPVSLGLRDEVVERVVRKLRDGETRPFYAKYYFFTVHFRRNFRIGMLLKHKKLK